MSSNQQQTAEIIPISIEKEMKSSYLDYAMSVIVSRAIPDVRDGLKPVQRRILYAMYESGNDYNKPYRKSARIVGDVMGKYHPHGDSAIYDALVRMAQPFSMGATLIDGQGNFGSIDNDPAAAMRYTESRMEKLAHKLTDDLDKDTVNFQANYDGNEQEPTVLPALYPNLLVNGTGGIAVGMATNIPPHNLGEVIDACIAYIDNNDITVDEMLEIVPGPDFPTGGKILGVLGSRSAVTTGRGSVIMRGKTHFEQVNKREAVIITEIPYQVNKARMVEKIGELVRDKKIEGIADLRDESDKSGIRVVVECKKDAVPDVVLNQLFHLTPLQTSFGVNMLALDNGRPKQLNLRDVIISFINFREEVITRRTNYLLGKARDKAHILIGLAMAIADIDRVIAIIKAAPNTSVAKENLMAELWNVGDVEPLIKLVGDSANIIVDGKCKFTEAQARAILDMRLGKLTGLERDKIDDELKELAEEINRYLDILQNRQTLIALMKAELIAVKDEFAVPRRSQIELSEFEQDIEDLIQVEDMVVSVTQRGYIKRVPLSVYRAQKRGGKGRAGVNMRDEEDVAIKVFATTTHTPLLFFSNTGMCYQSKVYKLPLGSPTSHGKALVNLFPLDEGEKITQIMQMPEDTEQWDDMGIIFATQNGNIRRNSLTDFKDIRSNGKIAIRLDESDKLIGVKPCSDGEHIFLAAKSGQAMRCPVDAVRVFKSRTSDGVRGMKLKDGDKIVSLSIIKGIEADIETRDTYLKIPSDIRMKLARDNGAEFISEVEPEILSALSEAKILELAQNEDFVLSITENGFGKRSSAYEYRTTNRGGSGVVNIVTNERNGMVAGCFPIWEDMEILVVTDKGKLIRCPIDDVRVAGRATQGVTVLKTADDETVVSASIVDADNDEEDDENEQDAQSSQEDTE